MTFVEPVASHPPPHPRIDNLHMPIAQVRTLRTGAPPPFLRGPDCKGWLPRSARLLNLRALTDMGYECIGISADSVQLEHIDPGFQFFFRMTSSIRAPTE